MDSRSILGLPAVRPPLLDHLSAAETGRRTGSRRRARRSGCEASRRLGVLMMPFRLDDIDDDPDDDDEGYYEDSEDDPENEDDEDENDDEEEETWQVLSPFDFAGRSA